MPGSLHLRGGTLVTMDAERRVVTGDLLIEDGGASRRVRKAEGVAVDPERGRVYVVCDRDAELYVFKLHDQ